MLVKCDLCGKMIDKKTAYRTEASVNKRDGTIGSKKVKCCSESEWLHKLKTDECKEEIWKFIREFFGDTQNTALNKEFSLWGDPIKVIRFINENRNRFDIMNTKHFDTEYGKIRYFSAIIKNNINDMPDEVVVSVPEPAETFEMYENKHKEKKKRRCLEDYE